MFALNPKFFLFLPAQRFRHLQRIKNTHLNIKVLQCMLKSTQKYDDSNLESIGDFTSC